MAARRKVAPPAEAAMLRSLGGHQFNRSVILAEGDAGPQSSSIKSSGICKGKIYCIKLRILNKGVLAIIFLWRKNVR
jgi:hypothetical protein